MTYQLALLVQCRALLTQHVHFLLLGEMEDFCRHLCLEEDQWIPLQKEIKKKRDDKKPCSAAALNN